MSALKPRDPPSGAFVCSSEIFSKGSICALQCDSGFASVKGPYLYDVRKNF